MQEKALIISIENQQIEAIHFEKEECASCTTGCAKIKNSFEISNPQSLEIKKGSVVIIESTKKNQAIQGIVSLLIPFLSSIVGYILGPYITKLFGKTISNDERAIFVLLFLAISSTLVFIISRKFSILGKPEVVKIL